MGEEEDSKLTAERTNGVLYVVLGDDPITNLTITPSLPAPLSYRSSPRAFRREAVRPHRRRREDVCDAFPLGGAEAIELVT